MSDRPAVRAALNGFDRLLEAFAALLVVVLLVVVSSGIFSRALNNPFSFTDELSGYLMVWLACLGWMIATRRGAHITIRYFLDRTPPGLQRLITLMFACGALLFGAVVLYGAVELIERNHDVEATTMPLSAAWLYVPFVPAALLTLVQAVATLISPSSSRPTGDVSP